jgi:WD40 repeat protein
VWNPANGQRTSLLKTPHDSNSVWAVAYSPDGKWFASGDSHGLILLWDAASHEVFAQFNDPQNGSVWNLTFSPDSAVLAAARDGGSPLIGNFTGVVSLYPVNPTGWEKDACAMSSRPLTAEDWKTYLPNREFKPYC